MAETAKERAARLRAAKERLRAKKKKYVEEKIPRMKKKLQEGSKKTRERKMQMSPGYKERVQEASRKRMEKAYNDIREKYGRDSGVRSTSGANSDRRISDILKGKDKSKKPVPARRKLTEAERQAIMERNRKRKVAGMKKKGRKPIKKRVKK